VRNPAFPSCVPFALASSALLFVAGCLTPHVDETSPQYSLKEQWKTQLPTPTVASHSSDAWWQVFEDQNLCQIEEEGLANSPTIQQAMARFEQAMCLVTITRSDQFPQLFLNGYGDRRRIPKALQTSASVPTGNIITPTTPAPIPVPDTGVPPVIVPPVIVPPIAAPEMKTVRTPVHVNDLIANFLVSYELDFWGKYYLKSQAAIKRSEEAKADFDTARLLLADQIAATYFTIQAMEEELRFLRQEITAHRERIELLKLQCDRGLKNTFPTLDDQAALETKIQLEQSLIQSREVNISLLAILVGREPNQAHFEISHNGWTFPVVPPGLPSTLLARRPDVCSAMKEVDALIDEIGVAKTELLPTISLSAAAGYQAGMANEWFKWKNRIWSLAASASQPLFDAGKRFAQIDAAKARFREVSAVLTKTVLTSVKEVEDALVAIKTQQERCVAALKREGDFSSIAILRNDLCSTGVQDYVIVLQAKEDVAQAQRERVNEEFNLQLSTLALMKSIGGSW
jgi:NodT family efflux transporter outer membrane factor (OMF) lipoprotein